jgi:hypothetical protein
VEEIEVPHTASVSGVFVCVLVLYAAVVSPSNKRFADSVGREDAEMVSFQHISRLQSWPGWTDETAENLLPTNFYPDISLGFF